MERFVILLGIAFLVPIIVLVIFTTTRTDKKRHAQDRERYKAALAALRDNPSDPDLNNVALKAGRRLYDENRIRNDIAAACAKRPR